jgi:hypothetical protein
MRGVKERRGKKSESTKTTAFQTFNEIGVVMSSCLVGGAFTLYSWGAQQMSCHKSLTSGRALDDQRKSICTFEHARCQCVKEKKKNQGAQSRITPKLQWKIEHQNGCVNRCKKSCNCDRVGHSRF